MRSFKLCVWLLVFSIISTSLFAADGILPGTGSEADPYRIEDMADYKAFLSEKMYNQEGVHTLLTVDIGYNTYSLTSVNAFMEYDNAFAGVFDGGNHTINDLTLIINVYIGYSDENATGLFPIIASTGVVKNLKLDSVYVKSNTYDVGGLCGRNWGTIENCHVSGYVYSSGYVSVGLLVANNAYGGGVVSHCSARGIVETAKSYTQLVGGLCGANEGIIENSYADCDVTGVNYVGGLVGYCDRYVGESYGQIINSYSTGTVTGNRYVGGLVGYIEWEVKDCYTASVVNCSNSLFGDFSYYGNGKATLLGCFWDKEVSDLTNQQYDPRALDLSMEELSGDVSAGDAVIVSSGALDVKASVTGEPVCQAGYYGNCLTFDGLDDVLSVTDYKGISFDQSRTLSMWVKTDASVLQVLTSWGDSIEDGQGWFVFMNPDGTYAVSITGAEIKSSTVVNDGLWHHIAVLMPEKGCSIGQVQLYLDGVLDDNPSMQSSDMIIETARSQDLMIGGMIINGANALHFNGSIDEFRLYCMPLSEADIALLAASQEPELGYCVNGLTTAEMHDIETYQNAGWDIVPEDQATDDSVWTMTEGQYPAFSWSQPRSDDILFNSYTLIGMSESEAITALAEVGITATVEYDYSFKYEAGSVITTIATKKILRNAEELTILVSSGEYDWSTNAGSGTMADPYLVSTPGMLFALRNDEYCFYKLVNDMDLQYYSFDSGCVVRSDYEDPYFTGSFDGCGYTVSNINISGGYSASTSVLDLHGLGSVYEPYCTGFFSILYGQALVFIENLTLDGIKIEAANSNGLVGGLVGACYSEAYIHKCGVNNLKMNIGSGTHSAGLLAGYGDGIFLCFSDNSRMFIETYQGYYGGLAGSGRRISNCYSNGVIEFAKGLAPQGVPGGLVGAIGESNSVSNSYSLCEITQDGYSEPIDSNGIFGTYSQSSKEVVQCFWDAQETGIGSVGMWENGAIGKSTDEMKNINTFLDAGWKIFSDSDGDKSSTASWYIKDGEYPELIWRSDFDGILASSIIGDTLPEAQEFLEENEISYSVEYDYSSESLPGTVFIVKGTGILAAGDSVTLVISEGPYIWDNNPGDGSNEDPWQISTAGMLVAANSVLNNSCFVLNNDIDLTGYCFDGSVIGDVNIYGYDVQLARSFDGCGHTISNIDIRSVDSSLMCGFFAANYGGYISNLNLKNVSMTISSFHLNDFCAGAFTAVNVGEISNCNVIGFEMNVVNSEFNHYSYLGGFSGISMADGSVNKSGISECSMTINSYIGLGTVGGFIGENNGDITLSYAEVDIDFTDNYSDGYVSGFCGVSENGQINSSCVTGSVGADSGVVYGFGSSDAYAFTNCYSAVIIDADAFHPFSYSHATGCFFDKELAGVGDDYIEEAVGFTTNEMQSIDIYQDAGWQITDNVEDISIINKWIITEGNYPMPVNQFYLGKFTNDDLIGLELSEVQGLLDAKGISYTIGYDYSGLYTEGKVCQVLGDTVLDEGDSVDLIVSLGQYDWENNPGDGSEANPWQISTIGMLSAISEDFNTLFNDHFIITDDIDAKGLVFRDYVICDKYGLRHDTFTGTIDGQGHVISNIYMENPQGSDNGGTGTDVAFITSSSGVIKNLTLDKFEIYLDVSCAGAVAGFTSWNRYDGVIKSCHITNSKVVWNEFSGNVVLSGFVNSNCGNVLDCSVSMNMEFSGGQDFPKMMNFGFAYENYGMISGCFADCSIIDNSDESLYLSNITSGFVGVNYEGIDNSYSIGSLTREDGGFVTGFCSDNFKTISNCYSAFNYDGQEYYPFAQNSYDIYNCFYDIAVAGESGIAVDGIIGLSTEEMKNKAGFVEAGWDFTALDGTAPIWQLIGDNYPTLYWQGGPDADLDYKVNMVDYAVFAANWLNSEPLTANIDFDNSGLIDLADLEIFAQYWLDDNTVSNGE